MAMTTVCGLGYCGSIPVRANFDPRICLYKSSDMMVITFKIGGCADHMNKKSDLIKKKN